MKKHKFLIVLLIFFSRLNAEFNCSSDVFYSWKDKDKEHKIFYEHLVAIGANEDDAKRNLETATVISKSKALIACRQNHENLSRCLSSKVLSTRLARQQSSFSGRQELDKAILADCKQMLGNCKDLSSSDPACREVLDPNAEPVTTSKADAKKK